MTMARVGIEQAFPNPAKRRAQRGRAQADIGVAEADLAVEAQNVRLETALAWVDLYYAKRRLAQLERLNESLGELQATVSARLASGSARPSQALEPEQLRAAVKDRRSELEAEVVKAFNTVFAQVLSEGADFGNGQTIPVFVASDSERAKQTAKSLAESMGFMTVDAGGLRNARYLEPLAGLNIYLGYGAGLGTSIAPTWLRKA